VRHQAALEVGDLELGHDAPASGEAGADSAGIAVISHRNRAPGRRKFGQREDGIRLPLVPQPDRQIEIAVVEPPLPVDRELAPAHHPLQRAGVEAVGKLPKIILQISRALQEALEPSQGGVREGVELVEGDAMPAP
jgi:hypothetical protein